MARVLEFSGDDKANAMAIKKPAARITRRAKLDRQVSKRPVDQRILKP
ncbi:hypothetical protein [Nevskia ramosa]|nr:hypothetical protein [Nevskia ramosa]